MENWLPLSTYIVYHEKSISYDQSKSKCSVTFSIFIYILSVENANRD